MEVRPGLLGFRGDPKWRDMSDYLVHFTSREALVSILDDAHLKAQNEFGWFRSDAATKHLRISTCLSEVPIDQIDRLTTRRGHFGIGFRRKFVQSLGGARVWYAEAPQNGHLFKAFGDIRSSDPDRSHAMWNLTPFIDDVSPKYDFTWEREWRVPGGIKFNRSDVAFLIVPGMGGPALFENPAKGASLITLQSMDFWNDAFSMLGGPEDRWVDQFLQQFTDPINHLLWDKEQDGYFWMWPKWSTEEAVESIFSGLDYDAEMALIERLEGISSEWLSIAEMRDLELP